MMAYRSEEEGVWRGRVGAALTPASDRFITRIVAALLFVLGFAVVVVVGLSSDFPAPKLLLVIGAVPSALWLAFRRQRHVDQVSQSIAIDEAVARHRAFSIGGKTFVVKAAAHRDGKLVLVLPYQTTLTLDMQGDLAAHVVRVLGVRDIGVRSVLLAGPITARLGNAFTTGCGFLAAASGLIVFSGSNLSTQASIAFGVLFVTCLLLAIFSLFPRLLVVNESDVTLGFLGRTRTIRYENLESLSLDGCTLTLKVTGEAPLAFTLSTRRFMRARLPQDEMNTLAYQDAVAPIEMASRRLAA